MSGRQGPCTEIVGRGDHLGQLMLDLIDFGIRRTGGGHSLHPALGSSHLFVSQMGVLTPTVCRRVGLSGGFS